MLPSPDPIRQAPPPRRPGRPRLAEAPAIAARILAAATGLFVELGFEATSMELIARRAGVSKRTLYARFHGKEEVFSAAATAMAERKIREFEAIAIEADSLHASLEEIAGKLIAGIVDRDSVAFERIIAAELRRFPGLAEQRSKDGLERLTEMIRSLLKRFSPFEAMDDAAVELDAKIFLAMVVLPPLRRAMFSEGSIEDIDRNFIGQSIAIFVRGTRAA